MDYKILLLNSNLYSKKQTGWIPISIVGIEIKQFYALFGFVLLFSKWFLCGITCLIYNHDTVILRSFWGLRKIEAPSPKWIYLLLLWEAVVHFTVIAQTCFCDGWKETGYGKSKLWNTMSTSSMQPNSDLAFHLRKLKTKRT